MRELWGLAKIRWRKGNKWKIEIDNRKKETWKRKKIENQNYDDNKEIEKKNPYIYLFQVDLIELEPLADEDDDRTAKLVNPTLVEAPNTRDLAQILSLGTAEEPLIPDGEE